MEGPLDIERFIDRERAMATRSVIHVLLGGSVVAFGLSLVVPENTLSTALGFYGPVFAVLAVARWQLTKGRARLVAWATTSLVLLAVFIATWGFGGLAYGNPMSYIVCVMVAVATLGTRAAIVVAALCMAGVAIVLGAELAEILPPSALPYSPINAFTAIAVSIGMATYLSFLSARSFRRALAEAQRRTEQLAETQAKLAQSQKLDLVGRLAGSVAHDLNNLLMVVTASESSLREAVDDAASVETLEVLGGAIDRASLMTRQLLTLSRPAKNVQGSVDVGAVIEAFLPLTHRLVGDGIRIAFSGPDAPIHTLASDTAIEQIILNLLVNARDAMPEGGTIEVNCFGEPDAVILEVRDEGEGMTPEIAKQVFEPFFTTKTRGTGLGLATVKDIVDGLGGTVSVASAPGEGSTFRIALPRTELPSGLRKVVAASGRASGTRRRRRVLVVDDNELVGEAIATMLRRAGFEPTCVGDALEALSTLERFVPDLIISDISMPGISGTELVTRLRERGQNVPVILVSGDTPPSTIELRPGDTHFLLKPFRSGTLLTEIEACLDARVEPGRTEH